MEINIINLKQRSDRWDYISNLFKDFNIKRFEAIQHKEGWIGCTLSHMELIKKAKENNEDYLIVMEDDTALFDVDGFPEKFRKIMDYLPKNLKKWDIFQFGVTYSVNGNNDNVHIINEDLDIIEYQYGQTTNFIVYNKSTYDKMLDNKMIKLEDDVVDQHMNNFNFRLWTTIPFISYQKDDYSDILLQNISYKEAFISNEIYLKSKIKK